MNDVVRGPRTLALLLAALVLTAVNLRTSVTGFSPLLDIVALDVGFGPSLYGVFGTVITASFAVFGFVAAWASRRLGLEWSLALATAVTSLGVVLRATSQGAPGLVLSTAVAFAGVGMSNVLIVPIVKRYFAARLKAVSSLYLALLQLGQFVAPLVAVPLAREAGWRVAVGGWAVLTVVASAMWVVAALVARRSPAGPTAPPPDGGGPAAAAGAPGDRLIGAWRSPLLWSMVAMFGMTALHTYTIITWLPAILVDAGADPAQGGALLALFSIFGLGAAFVVPPLVLHLRNPVGVVAACVALMAVGYAGLLLAPLAGAVVWVVCLGLGVSTFPLCLTLVNARTRTTAGSSLLSGAMQGVGYGLACVGPLLLGLLREWSGGWGASYAFLFATLGVLLVSGVVACRPQHLEDGLLARR